jgi:arabinofuranosyltransferase
VLLTARDSKRWGTLLLIAATVLAGLAHTVFVVRTGGDFMHGRFLLPCLFALTVPISVVSLPRPSFNSMAARISTIAALVMAVWAIAALLIFRPAYSSIGPDGIADERAVYATMARHANPVSPADFEHGTYGRMGAEINSKIGDSPRRLLLHQPDPNRGIAHTDFPLAAEAVPALSGVGAVQWIGVIGWFSGASVHVVDLHGLADPLASRLLVSRRSGRPGHEKLMPVSWVVARFATPETIRSIDSPSLAAATAVLQCPPMRELLDAVAGPLTLERFLRNVWLAPRLTAFRIPGDPIEARTALCSG